MPREYDESGKFPREILKGAWELGLFNTCIPSEYGGVVVGILDSVPDRGGALLGLRRDDHLDHVQRPRA